MSLEQEFWRRARTQVELQGTMEAEIYKPRNASDFQWISKSLDKGIEWILSHSFRRSPHSWPFYFGLPGSRTVIYQFLLLITPCLWQCQETNRGTEVIQWQTWFLLASGLACPAGRFSMKWWKRDLCNNRDFARTAVLPFWEECTFWHWGRFKWRLVGHLLGIL